MSGRDALSFQQRLDDHDKALAAARAQAPAPGVAAARLADAVRVEAAAAADLTGWRNRLRRNRALLQELRQRQLVERLAMQRTARRIVWGWPAIRLRILIVSLWVQVHPILTGFLLLLLTLGILALIFPHYAEAIMFAVSELLKDPNRGRP